MSDSDLNQNAFHPGELTLQSSIDAVEKMAPIGERLIRNVLIEQHKNFYPELPCIFIGALDDLARPWATLAYGKPGFIHAASETSLHIDARPIGADLLNLELSNQADVGLLGLNFSNRRRNRLNGTVNHSDKNSFSVELKQSYGNCPKYIQIRDTGNDFNLGPITDTHSFSSLDTETTEIIKNSDCFFIASAYLESDIKSINSHSSTKASAFGVDVSHRGGKPGFVKVTDNGQIVWDDYPGNKFFNTLGNILANPQTGLLFIDFDKGDLFLLNGKTIIYNYPEAEVTSMSTGKILRKAIFDIEQGIRFSTSNSLSWPTIEYSPALDD